MNVLDEWTATACRELGLAPDDARTRLVLDLARDVAHNVVRPGAPVTAYLLGLAVGRGADPATAAARLTALAATWPSATPGAASAAP
ncbi:hypothetical protein SAMN05444365_101949 [Micromonospora pattaloongensis]|uniref:DUF6457 domain-containing protein n=1 Tax=Micromonospora pattaloongensis TaxID=405436 RepID=A0A1H3HQH4_9ACTN|nr:DUF6457 domain-containing protein [Micromonospora pattaloongensis]SDY17776.1 hypothetical protein SAMN05444365_101949 [Micromonospora pattaloongensis]